MKAFEDIHKYISLLLSDRLSAELKLNFDLKHIQCANQEFQTFSSDIPRFSYIALFKFKTRGILLLIDPKIIYVLTNRMLGGKGIIETKPKPLFTVSELFMANKLVNWFSDFYTEHHLEIKFLRVENNLDMVHFFYPDESIFGVKMNCKINQKEIGTIACCYPELIMSSKESAWAA